MLRTAQEIIDETFERANKDALVSEIYIMAVNTARMELLKEFEEEAQFDIVDMEESYVIGKQFLETIINQIK